MRLAVVIADQVAVVVDRPAPCPRRVANRTRARPSVPAKNLISIGGHASMIWASWRSMVRSRRATVRASRSAARQHCAVQPAGNWLSCRRCGRQPTATARRRGIGLAPAGLGTGPRPRAAGSQRAGQPPRPWRATGPSLPLCTGRRRSRSAALWCGFARVRWGSKGRRAAPRKVPCQQRQAYDMGRLAVCSSVGSVAVMI